MRKRFHACDLNQPFLLSPVVQDWLPENHLARFVGELCEQLDLSRILNQHERRDGRGKAAYHPLMLTRLLLYSYCIGIRSSRQIERATRQDLAFRYLAANQQPDHDTIAAFRQEHLDELAGLFTQVLQMCREVKLVRMGLLAIDGTKIQANASRSETRSYQDLHVSEGKLRERMQQLLLEAQKVDEAESAEQIATDLLPDEYTDAQQRLKKIEQAKAALEQRAKEEAAKVKAEVDKVRESGGKLSEALRKRRTRKRAGVPKAEAQANLTDPDSQLMVQSGHGFVQGYNGQLAVDAESQVIVAALVCQNPEDRNQLLPVLAAVQQQDLRPAQVLADAGYWNGEALQDKRLEGIGFLVPPDAQRPGVAKALPANAPKSEFAQQMRERLNDPHNQAIYRKRQGSVEPVFGFIKEIRGVRRFQFRGLAKVHAEWMIICLTHNLLKLYKHSKAAPVSPHAPNAPVRQRNPTKRRARLLHTPHLQHRCHSKCKKGRQTRNGAPPPAGFIPTGSKPVPVVLSSY